MSDQCRIDKLKAWFRTLGRQNFKFTQIQNRINAIVNKKNWKPNKLKITNNVKLLMVEVPPKKIRFAPVLFFLLAVATVFSEKLEGNHFEGVQIFSFYFKIR